MGKTISNGEQWNYEGNLNIYECPTTFVDDYLQ
jgi:hypothetical protein